MDNDLLDIKASGFYFLEYDRSQIIRQTQQNRLPLVPISTKQGVLNNPVYIDRGDMATFERIFGSRDRIQESYGNYSYLAAQYLLTTSPVIFINLRSLDDTLDLADSLSISTTSDVNNVGVQSYALSKYYNTHRFWFIDPNKLLKTTNSNDVLQFANVGNRNISIFVVKSKQNVAGYNTTVSQYYANKGEEYPKYLDKDSLMSDTVVDVYMFRADLTSNSSTNQFYGYLFDSNGKIKKTVLDAIGVEQSALDQLISIKESEFVGKYTGSLIPTALDERGNSFAIDTIINSGINTHKVSCALNTDVIESKADWEYDIVLNPNDYPLGGQPLPIDITGNNIISIAAQDEVINASKIMKKTFLSYDLSNISLKTLSAYNAKDDQIDKNVIKYTGIRFESTITGTYNYTIKDRSIIYVGADMPHIVGEKYWGVDGRFAYITNSQFVGIERVLTLKIHSNELPIWTDNTVFPKNVDGIFVYPTGHADEGEPVEYDGISGYPLDGVGGTAIPYPTLTAPQLAVIYTDYGINRNVYKLKLSKDLYVDGYTGAVTSVTPLTQMKIQFTNSTFVDVFSDDDVSVFYVPEPDFLTQSYTAFNLKSYVPRPQQFVNGTASKQKEILDILIQPNMLSGLKNKELIDFRYIVDAFKTYIESNAKYQFGYVCKEQKLSAAIVNEVFTDDFKNSLDPYFRSTENGDYSAVYYKTGGNTRLPYTKLYEKPNATYGDSYIYSYQCLLRTENRRNKSFISAPIVAGLFIDKLRSRKASDAVMGEDFQIIADSILGADNDYDDTERGELEPYGMNPIVKKDGKIQVYANTTNQYRVKSALSYIHNREVIIEFRRSLIPILNYAVGKDNTEQLRTYIKQKVDDLCESLRLSGAISRYINTMDETNNTAEIVENAYALIDTQLWFNYKMQKVVHRSYYNSNNTNVTFQTV